MTIDCIKMIIGRTEIMGVFTGVMSSRTEEMRGPIIMVIKTNKVYLINKNNNL